MGSLHKRRQVNKGVPEKLVLGLVLYYLLINELELGLSNEVVKFGDTKLFWLVKKQKLTVKCSKRSLHAG